jgi:hypothetical protein
VQARLDRNPDKMRERRQTVEHPFGTIKSWMGPEHSHGLKPCPEWARRLGASPQKRIVASWSGSRMDSTEYKVAARASRPSVGSPLRRADLGLTNGAGGLDVNNDAELHVDEIIVGVSEKCRSLVSSGPLGRGIGWRDELRHNVGCGSCGCRKLDSAILMVKAAKDRS